MRRVEQQKRLLLLRWLVEQPDGYSRARGRPIGSGEVEYDRIVTESTSLLVVVPVQRHSLGGERERTRGDSRMGLAKTQTAAYLTY